MRYGKLQANLSDQSSELGNLATFTLSITSTVRRPNFQTPVLSPGTTIWANVSDMVNLESVEHPQPHFMKINFLAFIVLLPYIWLSYNTVQPNLTPSQLIIQNWYFPSQNATFRVGGNNYLVRCLL